MSTEENGAASHSNRRWIAGALGVLLLTALFYGLFWNRYIGISLDGWFQLYGEEILRGKIPYRDFYLFTNPLHALTSAGISAAFGTQWWVLRLYGVLQRLALALVAFVWLKRAGYAPAAATAGTVLAIAVFGCDIADPLFYYHHDSIFYCVLAGFFSSLGITSQSKRALAGWLLLTGVMASMAFLTKQTTGFGITFIVFAAPTFSSWRMFGFRRAMLAATSVLAGWLILPLGLCAWLVHESAFFAYADQVFLRGPTSKGPILEVLVRPILTILHMDSLRAAAFAAILAILGIEFWSRSCLPSSRGAGTRISVFTVIGFMLVAILAGLATGIAMPDGPPNSLVPLLQRLSLPVAVDSFEVLPIISIYVAFLTSIGLFVRSSIRLMLGRDWGTKDSFVWLLSTVSLNNCYFLSLSWPAFEVMVFPGLALTVAHYLTIFQETRTGRGAVWASRFILLAACLTIVSAMAFKINRPFAWEGMIEPSVIRESKESMLPQLRGMKLAGKTVDRIERIVSLIQSHSSNQDEIFVFPHMPLFYILAGREPCTFSYVHFWDVCPDFVARADADRLLDGKHEPKVMIVGLVSQNDIEKHERNFRSGRPSGQRDLIQAIKKLTDSGRYELLETIPGDQGMDVQVWSRK